MKKLTINEHDIIRRELLAGLMRDHDLDEIDEAVSDPIHDHLPQAAPMRKVRGVLGILDQLDKENINRRFTR